MAQRGSALRIGVLLAGLATGDRALVGSAPSVALGCGFGASGGDALGQPLDDVAAER